jgi:hypothetical protein
MGATENLMTLGGLAAIGITAWYLHSQGHFDSIFAAINKGIDQIAQTKPLDGDDKKKEEEKKKSSKLAHADGMAYVGNYGAHRAYKSYVL